MALLKEDGSLDIERMINLPIEEHIKEIESLTEEQYQEFLSKLPLCNSQETPMHAIEVDYTMETDGVDAEEVIDNIGKNSGS